MAASDELTNIESLVPTFSNEQVEEIKLYFDISQKFKTQMEEELIAVLTVHPVWGALISSMSEEARKKNSEISEKLQKDAIYNGNWLPYIHQQIQQGIFYAKLGYNFNNWYELVNMIRDYMVPVIAKEFEHDSVNLTHCLNGMNRFFDFAMSILGEAYIFEKKKIIADNLEKQEKLNKELESFAYIISHDLKTPLRGISSLSEWFIQDYSDVLDENGKEFLELLKDRVKRMENLIDGVLIYSRVGRVGMETTKVDLKKLIQEHVHLAQYEKKVDLSFKGDFPVLETSKVMFSQLFGNIIDNAVKYCNKEEVKIEIGAKKEDDNFTFYVKDNGPGIPEDFHEKVFQIFHTLDTKDENKSTGIGLTIVKKIIDIFEGEIHIRNPKEGGAMFEFTIPQLKEI